MLLGKRKGSFRSGYWGIPGGRVEVGEPLKEAAKRELEEETGLKAVAIEFVGTIREFQKTHDFVHFGFVCLRYKGEVEDKEPDKCEGWQWWKIETLPDKILPGHKTAIKMWLEKDTNKLRDM